MPRPVSLSLSLLLTACFLVAACGSEESGSVGVTPPAEPAPNPGSGAAGVGDARLVGADAESGNWLTHGRTYAEQRYSPLDRRSTSSNVREARS